MSLLSVENNHLDCFPMGDPLLSRESLWYLCGFSRETRGRYIDDQAVNCLICAMVHDTSTSSTVNKGKKSILIINLPNKGFLCL